jgi:beta-lactamase superfamily II metal-dependent hydrolase
VKEAHTSDERPLEIIFLDVGQGDGSVLITPERGADEKIMIIDAGEGENMHNFLNTRFKAYRGFDFDSAIITHPDEDHYLGFKSIFSDHNVGFKTIYQNGLVERPVSGTFEKLGGLTEDPLTKTKYMTDLVADNDHMERLFTDPIHFGTFKFPPVMHAAIQNPKIRDFKMLSSDDRHSVREAGRNYIPGLAPSDQRGYTVEVLGPVVENDLHGNPRLKKISSYGKTKNGHSIILRLHIGDFKVLFGGDLNVPAEKYLLKHYAGIKRFPKKDSPQHKEMLEKAGMWFGAEIMKVCHHGASDVTDEFMKAVNPACFVISSGDSEGHVHPRPDLLGRLGKFGRGESPVLLSTELQRSTREREDAKLVKSLQVDIQRLANSSDEKLKVSVLDRILTLSKTNVEVYGSIYVKTDGQRMIAAFKIESKSATKKWFYFEYRIGDKGKLELV